MIRPIEESRELMHARTMESAPESPARLSVESTMNWNTTVRTAITYCAGMEIIVLTWTRLSRPLSLTNGQVTRPRILIVVQNERATRYTDTGLRRIGSS